jgi:tetratricopeptide (TPR) repeat protein
MYFFDDEEEDGRILNDKECVQALKDRDDIFIIKKETGFRNLGVLFLAAGVLLGVWLSTSHVITQTPVSQLNQIKERMAKLAREQVLPATLKENGEAKELSWVSGPNLKKVKPSIVVPQHPAPAGIKTVVDFHQSEKKDSVLPAAAIVQGKRADSNTTAGKPVDSGIVKGEPIHEGPPVAQADAIEDENTLITVGDSLKKLENYTPAITNYRRAIAKNPRNTQALAGLGDIYTYTGILDSAETFYSAAIAVNPRLVGAHNGLGSVRYYNSSLAANPHYADFRNIHNAAEYIKAQYDSSIIEYTNAFNLDTTFVEALTNRGVVREIHGDREEAVKDYTHAIKINPKYAEAYTKRASNYRSSGKFGKAVADYSTAISLGTGSYVFDPMLHYANAYFGRGTTYYKMGELDKAIADFDSTLRLSPKHSLAILNKAVALSDAKRYDSAIAGFTLAIGYLAPTEYNGAKYLGYLRRGNVYKTLGKYDLAIADFTAVLESSNLAGKACVRIAECYALKHDKSNAINWLKKSVTNGFTNTGSWKRNRNLSFLWGEKEFNDLFK